MPIRTLILDDDPNSHKAACQALSHYPDLEILGQFTTAGELKAFLSEQSADVLFLDIEIGEDFGFSVARTLRELCPELMIVFLTGHSSYAVDGYDFQPVNFLTKPINPVKLEQTVCEIRRRMQRSEGQRKAQLMFRLQQGYRIVDVRQICCIERRNRKNYLRMEQESLQISGYAMRELDHMLTGHGFFLCHQSFLVNIYRITGIRDAGRQLYEVTLQGLNGPVPVSRNHYEGLRSQLLALGIHTV